MKLNKLPIYLIQEWLFKEAEGKYEIDLGESGVQHQYLSDLNFDKNQHLNYSSDSGNDKLRNLLASYYGCLKSNICITHGGQEALYLFYRSFLKQNDHVITFVPGWSQSWVIPEQIGCTVSKISLDSKDNFQLNIDTIKSKITENTKLIILNYPNNPTGVNLDSNILNQLITLCKTRGIFLLNDEEYLYKYENSIINYSKFSGAIGSLSKIYGFPATRIGWFIGPEDIVDQMINYRRYVSVCNSSLCEELAIEILQQKDKHIERYKELVVKGSKILNSWLNNNLKLQLIHCGNTPYAYIILPKSWNSDKFCHDLLQKEKILLMPASVFGHKENAFRITYAREESILNEGLNRIQNYINTI